MPIEFLHDDFHFGQSHTGPSCYLHENARRVCQRATSIHQRTLERLCQCIMSAIIGIGFPKAEQASPVATAQSSNQIVEADANESRPLDQIHDRTNTLTDGGVGF